MLLPRTALPPPTTTTSTPRTPTPPQPPAHSRRQSCFKRRDIDFNFFQFLCQEREKKKEKKKKGGRDKLFFDWAQKKILNGSNFFQKCQDRQNGDRLPFFQLPLKKERKIFFLLIWNLICLLFHIQLLSRSTMSSIRLCCWNEPTVKKFAGLILSFRACRNFPPGFD